MCVCIRSVPFVCRPHLLMAAVHTDNNNNYCDASVGRLCAARSFVMILYCAKRPIVFADDILYYITIQSPAARGARPLRPRSAPLGDHHRCGHHSVRAFGPRHDHRAFVVITAVVMRCVYITEYRGRSVYILLL